MHISITNPDRESDLPYFSGKAEMEEHLKQTGLSHAILRPAVLFGKEDILINNIAWALRHLPLFGIYGDGRYRLQPIHVDDLAAAAVARIRSNQRNHRCYRTGNFLLPRHGGDDRARDRLACADRSDAADARLPGRPRAWLDSRGM